MKVKYNLFNEKWIHIENINNQNEVISLSNLVKNPDYYKALRFPFPGHNLAVLRYIISLLYVHHQPKDNVEWIDMYNSNPFEPVDDFIKKFKCYTDLFNTEKPFKQSKHIKKKEKTNEINKILPQHPAKSGTQHFYHNEKNSIKVDINLIPSLLLSAHLYVPLQAGQGYKKHINGIPLYFFINGNTLKETIMLNTLTKEFLKEKEAFKSGFMKEKINIDDLLGIEQEEDIPSDKISIVTGLNWKSRRIKIEDMEESKEICTVTGKKANYLINYILYDSNNGNNGYWWDTMVVRQYNEKSKQKETPFSNLRASTYKPLWKGYRSILGVTNQKEKNHLPLIVDHYNKLKMEYEKLPIYIPLSAFGFIYKEGGKAYLSYIEEELLYSNKIIDSEVILYSLSTIIEKTNEMCNKLKSILSLKIEGSKERMELMSYNDKYVYWKGLESKFKNSLLKMIENEESSTKIVEEWKDYLNKYTVGEFDKLITKAALTGKNMKKIALAKINLRKTIKNILK